MRRHLGRSVLIATLIAVPIAGAAVMDGLLQTMTSPEAHAYAAMGNADGQAEITEFATLPDWQPGGYPQEMADKPDRDPKSVDLARLLPPGSRVTPESVGSSMRLTEGDRVVRTQLDQVDVGNPLTDHLARLGSGRLPAGPDEVLVTESLAERLGLLDGDRLKAGATVTAEGAAPVAVTGLAVTPQAIDQQAVVAPPGTELVNAPGVSRYYSNQPPRFLVDLPPGADIDAVWPKLAADHGVTLMPRAAFTERERYPAMWSSSDSVVESAGPVALVVGFGLLEVMLLAGAAFAVGARRQVRELGLIAANGGTAKHVGRTVLAQGLILGLLGAVGGLLLGVLVIFGAWGAWEQLTGQVIDGWRFGWIELTVAGLVGLLSGLAAALLPAIGVARMRPVDALAQRFRTTSLGARLPILGVVLLGVGIVGVLGSGVVARGKVEDYLAQSKGQAMYVSPDLALPTIGVLVAGLVTVVGMIMITSGLVATLARMGGRLPLSGRLAIRDAGRHRHRTVPAIAAIMIVVAGSVTLAFTFAAVAAGGTKSQPDNTLLVHGDPSLDQSATDPDKAAEGQRQLADGTRAMVAELPGSASVEMKTAHTAEDMVLVGSGKQDGTCNVQQIGVATPQVLALVLGGRPDAGVRAALDRGEVVALDQCVVVNGATRAEAAQDGAKQAEIAARYVERPAGTYYWDLPGAYMSPEAIAAHGWSTSVTSVAVTYPADSGQDGLDAALTAAEDHGLDVWEPSDEAEQMGVLNLGLAAAAGLVTLLGVSMTVALSAAESRADLATLAAIGAQPRRRRMLAGAQALVLSAVGTVLGLVLGGVLGYAAGALTGKLDFAVPWSNLGITVVVVPLLAVAVAMVATRSKLPMVRRVE
jgi:putative ABC transport system permease protein